MGRFTQTRQPAELEATVESVLAGAREHVDVAIPGTDAKGKMRVLTRSESFTVKAAALTVFRDAGLVDKDGAIATAALEDWRCELAARHLAIAVRETVGGPPLASIEEWRDELSDEQISGPWNAYQDLCDRLDPLGVDSRPITVDEIVMMRVASKKKDVGVLMSFGSHKLALFAITSADPPAT